MTARRRLLWGLAVAAAVLLTGRALALVWTDYLWFDALGAGSLWHEQLRSQGIVRLTCAIVAGIFAFANLSAVRRSIVALAVPRRLGNVEFGEAVPGRYMERAVFGASVAFAAAMTFLAPGWQHLALARSGVIFGESDPFFQSDLSFYVARLPLEIAFHRWMLVLVLAVSVVAVGLYALTPSLRWERGAFRVTVHVRRHLSVLAALFLLLMAWSYRLDGFELLITGTGEDGMFSPVDHRWLIPAYLSLSVGVVAGAALVAVSGWTGQIRTSFFAVTAVLLFAVAFDLVLPSMARRLAGSTGAVGEQDAYRATRAAFTRRAYALPRQRDTLVVPREVDRFSAGHDSTGINGALSLASQEPIVLPGAQGSIIAAAESHAIGPRVGGFLSRLAHSWARQRTDVLSQSVPPDARLVSHRDVMERTARLAPVFAQGSGVAAGFLGDTLVWIVELYSASSTYPLSELHVLAGRRRSYFRHAGTALLNSVTGRFVIVPAESPDPVAQAWRARFPEQFRAGGGDLLDELSDRPLELSVREGATPAPGSERAFRAEVTRLYERMRAALVAGDLRAFGAAYDSLGGVIGAR